jgi:hypothetical protein
MRIKDLRGLVLLLGSVAAVPMASAATEFNAEEVKKLVHCFRLADRYQFTAERRRSGVAKDQLLAEIDEALGKAGSNNGGAIKQIVEEVYAQPPQVGNSYVGSKIGACLSEVKLNVDAPSAGRCFELTLFAKEMFRAKRQGLVVEQIKAVNQKEGRRQNMSEGQVRQLDEIADAVYASRLEEHRFRPLFFLRCVPQSR